MRTLPLCAVWLLLALMPGASAQELPPSASEQTIFLWRGLPEPLVPTASDDTEERTRLIQALNRFAARSEPDDFSALEAFLNEHPDSPWRVAVATNLGLFQYRSGYFSRCIDSYKKAWELGEGVEDPKVRALADLAGGEYVKMLSRLGRMDEIRTFLEQVKDHTFQGPATERVAAAKQGLAQMEQRPEIAFRCGPLAVASILISQGKPDKAAETLSLESTVKGTSLAQVADLSKKLGLDYQVAYRLPGASVIYPSIIHWKVGHYAALLDKESGRYHTKDPTFENDTWHTPRCLDEQASGYFLIPAGPLPSGWEAVGETEAAQVFGKGVTSGNDEDRTGPDDHKSGGGGGPGGPEPRCSAGMAVYSFHTLVVSLNIEDTPVGYQPPYGYPVYFTATYNQREAGQPANFAYSNLGKKWTHNWLSYVTDDPAVPSSLSLATGGGGTQRFNGYNSTTQSFAPQVASRSVMRRISSSPIVYELEYPDGSKDRFAASDGSSTAPRKVFLTQRLDPHGNALTLAYDGQRRLTAITDAIGQATTFSYESSDPYLITKVTDPFGRFAIFSFTPSGRLVSIQDVLGLQSQFSYTGASDFIQSLTTPYGTTNFTTYEAGSTRKLTATDPLNQTEVLEFNQDQVQPSSLPADLLPAGMNLFNQYLHGRNSYFWSKKAWTENPGDYAAAYLYHWLHGANASMAASPLESEKPALSARIWYNYPGQGWAGGVGASERPSKIGRRLTDGTTQLQQYEYNDLGRVVAYTDPLGRQTQYRYAANNQDLLAISVGNGGTLASYTYNAQHLPLTATDAAGHSTTYTYNTQGQVTSVTNPKGETTTYSYFGADAAGRQRKGRLSVLNGPLPGDADTATFDYDALGRVSQSTTPDGYTVSYEYDVFDRITRVIFPDGTTEEASYDRLHLSSQKDRLGRVTSFLYNSLRQLVSTTDPAGRQVKYEWCRCGDLKSLIDTMGRVTFWKHDVQGRVSYKQYPDGSRETYGYDPSNSRLISVTDAKGQVKNLAYNLDNSLAGVSYQNAQTPTPGVSYAYDAVYGRLTSMTDGIGTTTYAYHDFPDLQPPISVYSLNQNLADAISGSAQNVVAVGGPAFSSEVPAAIGTGHSMNFDGATQYLEIGDSYNPESYTISTWVRPEAIQAQSILLRAHASGPFSGCSHQIRMNSEGKFEHYVWDGSGKTVTGTTTAVAGTWYHVAIVSEKNGQARLFVNGTQEGAPVNVGTIWTGGSKWVVGSNSPGSMTFFDGQIDDIRFWWAALDQPRINDVSMGAPPLKMPGAGRLASVDGPWANDTIAYTYDELGRIAQRSIGGVPESFAFDAAGRPASVSNPLGSFAIGYDGVTSRVLSITHSGGQKTEYSYLPAAQDFRLQRIRHLKPDGTTPLSVFDYTYDAMGRILSWRQQEGTSTAQARTWAFGYDQADQLTSAGATQGGATVQSYSWSYDPAGNRLTQTLDGATATSSYNALNELIHTTATLPAQTYEWDAEDRLLAINQGTARTEFTYDGLGRRVRLVEKQNGSVVSTQSYLWEGLTIREQRDANGSTVNQRYFGSSYVDLTSGSPQSYLQTTDHLGSIRETTDTVGNLVQRVSYDFWGNPSFATGAATSPFAFTGHFRHAGSGLHLAPYRGYAATTGRWISRDPIGEVGGINLYAYVENIPNLFSDQLGLNPDDPTWIDREVNSLKLPFGYGNCRLDTGCKGRVHDRIGSKNCRGWPEEEPGAIPVGSDCPDGYHQPINVCLTHPVGQDPHGPGYDYRVENDDGSWTYDGHIERKWPFRDPTPDKKTEPGQRAPNRGVEKCFQICRPK